MNEDNVGSALKAVRAAARGRREPARDAVLADRLVSWLIWKVWLPLLLLGLMWPIYGFVMGFADPFERAYAHGELLIFASLVFVEVGIEGKHAQKHGEASIGFKAFVESMRAVGFLLIFVFGVIRSDVVRSAWAEGSSKLTAYACVSCSFALLAAVMSVWFAWWMTRKETVLRLRSRVGLGG